MDLEVKKEKKKAYSKLGFKPMEAVELTDALNNLLANYSVHYQKLRNYHWNVKGPEFFDVHEKFEDQYNDAKVAIDDIAERIRVFNQTPLSTMADYLKKSEIKETGTDLSAMEMVEEILQDYRMILEHLMHVVEMAVEHGDSGTEDLAKGLIKKVEKNHWMMLAFSQQS
ncbi:Dps family protein [Algoriphagus sediminis]|uniref:DNA starvation/stationary phase protection protein n=1 Tax=Algoriphagus sediminis TaxID=3057113 RepID=A0ABT7YFD0_9BACT|nr:DNA starvation/stationary phase protection protein [Algoriphagus sediminis]MDN3205231.1 DNA starvation/stationary phase protection protein [Algoriphagus sediminis]